MTIRRTVATAMLVLIVAEARAWLVPSGFRTFRVDAAGDIYGLTGDLEVTKLSGENGAELWTHSAAHQVSSFAQALGIDADGNVLLAGSDNHSDNESDFVIAKLAGATGAEIWRTALVEPYNNGPYALVIDPSGDVVTIGYLHARYPDVDPAVIKFSGSTGAELWRFVTTDEIGAGWSWIAIDSAGDVVVSGFISHAPIVMKLSGTDGTTIWTHPFVPGTGVGGIAIDAGGDILGPGATADGANVHPIVLKLAGADGHQVWRTDLDDSTPNERLAQTFALTAGGDIVVAGALNGAADKDFTVIRFAGDTGAETWRFTADGTSHHYDEAVTVAVDGAGDVFAVGGIGNVGGMVGCCNSAPLTVVKLDGATGAERWRRLRPARAQGLALAAQADPIMSGLGTVKLRGADGAEACGTVACGTCETCDASGTCAVGPRPWCVQETTKPARLFLRTSATHERDRLSWKGKDPLGRTALEDFGDPRTAGAPYDLCMFDQPAGTSRLFLHASIPAGGSCGAAPCWRQSGASKFIYHDGTLANAGLSKIIQRAGLSGGTSFILAGQGPNLGLPASIALVPPVRVQYQMENGQCWETQHSAAAVKENGPDTFRAVGP
jgi:outer membrane protein assembly factor BamB